jgi:hypothetical protein
MVWHNQHVTVEDPHCAVDPDTNRSHDKGWELTIAENEEE